MTIYMVVKAREKFLLTVLPYIKSSMITYIISFITRLDTHCCCIAGNDHVFNSGLCIKESTRVLHHANIVRTHRHLNRKLTLMKFLPFRVTDFTVMRTRSIRKAGSDKKALPKGIELVRGATVSSHEGLFH